MEFLDLHQRVAAVASRQRNDMFNAQVLTTFAGEFRTSAMNSTPVFDQTRGELNKFRNLYNKNPYAQRIINVLALKAIQQKGILADTGNSVVDDTWNKAYRPSFDLPHNKFQMLALKSYLRDGGLLMRLIWTATEFRWQMVDYALLSEIRYDEEGIPVSYRLDGYRELIPAWQIKHLFRRDFGVTNQASGRSLLYPVESQLNNIADLETAVVDNAVRIANNPGFFTQEPNVAALPHSEPIDPTDSEADQAAARERNRQLFQATINPGRGKDIMLPSGVTWNQKDRNGISMGESYADIKKSLLRSVASGVGISYALLSSDVETANYSSIRTAHNEDKVLLRELQSVIVELYDYMFSFWRVYNQFYGLLPLDIQIDPKWLLPGFQSPNLKEDAEAYRELWKIGAISLTTIIRQLGFDPEQIFAEERAEVAIRSAPNVDTSVSNDTED